MTWTASPCRDAFGLVLYRGEVLQPQQPSVLAGGRLPAPQLSRMTAAARP